MAPTPQGTTITIAGQVYRPVVDTSFEQDLYAMQLVSEAGLTDLAASFEKDSDKDLETLATRLVLQAFRSGKLFELLAAVIQGPGPTPWSIEQAQVNAKVFATLTAPEDKKALQGSLVGVILGFFVSGVVSLKTSQKYSDSPKGPDAESPDRSEESSASGTGMALSGS